MWIFARPGEVDGAAALREFRRLNPWFHRLSDRELAGALVVGSGDQCAAQLEGIARELRLDLPVLDLSGLGAEAARRALEALAPGK
jgi:hypothetical protein